MFETREGVIHFFRSKTFCPTEPKKIEGEPFFVSQKFWYQKIFGEKGGEYQEFPSENFCLTLPKKFVGNPFVLHYFWVSTNLMLQRAKSRFSVEKFFYHSAENFRRRPLLFLINFGYRKTLMIGERVIHVFRSKFFVAHWPKKS